MGEGNKNHAQTVSVFLNGLHEQNDAVRQKIRDNMSKYATFDQVIEATGRKVENKKKKDARKKTKKILAPVINNSRYEQTTERSSRPSTRYQRNDDNPQHSNTQRTEGSSPYRPREEADRATPQRQYSGNKG